MSEKKFVLNRSSINRGYNYLVSGDSMSFVADENTVEFFRAHPWVEDRTRPDYSDVPVGTAGTATVRGVEGRALRTGQSSWVVIRPDGLFEELFNDDITDFTPDRVVDAALENAIDDALWKEFDGASAHRVRAMSAVVSVLRGQSS